MATNNLCPECDSTLPPSAKSCSCGWQAVDAPVTKRKNEDPIPTPTVCCEWKHQGERCPMPATLKDERTAGRWMCTMHARHIHDHEKSLAFFQDVDRKLDNRATQYAEMLTNMHASTRYWEKKGYDKVVKQNHEQFVSLTQRAPEWFKRASQTIRGLVIQMRRDFYQC